MTAGAREKRAISYPGIYHMVHTARETCLVSINYGMCLREYFFCVASYNVVNGGRRGKKVIYFSRKKWSSDDDQAGGAGPPRPDTFS